MTHKAAALAALAMAFAAAPLAAQPGAPGGDCRLRIGTNAANWIIQGHDPFTGGTPTGTFDLLFTNDGDRPCIFHPAFSLDREAFGLQSENGGTRASYALADLDLGDNATPVVGVAQSRVGQQQVVVPPRQQRLLRYQLTVAGEFLNGDGLYSQRVRVDAEGADGIPLAGRELVLGVNVLPSATLSLYGTRLSGGRVLINLGELREGMAEVMLRLSVQSTRAYRLSVESQNNGRLLLPGTEWAIPYQLVLGNQSVGLEGGRNEVTSATGFGPRQEWLPINFEIGNVSDRRAGTYGDVISVSVEPL